MKKKPTDKYKFYNVLQATETDEEATVLMYGYIGEAWEYNNGLFEQVGVTDIEFVNILNDLAKQHQRINLRINSIGGDTFHGAAIVNAIRNCTAEVHTYIDGIAASMAGAIWLAGHQRHMATNGLLMLHSASNFQWGTAKDMRAIADALDKVDNALALGIAEATGKTVEEIKGNFFDYEDHWLDYSDCKTAGFCKEEDDSYEAAKPPEKEMRGKSAQALYQEWYKEQQEIPSFFEQIRTGFASLTNIFSPPAPQPPQTAPVAVNTNNVNLEEFKKALAEGTLDAEAVRAALEEKAPAAKAPDHTAELAMLNAEVSNLKAAVAAFGKKPGEGKADPGTPEGDPPVSATATAKQQLDEANRKLAEMGAANLGAVKFVDAQ